MSDELILEFEDEYIGSAVSPTVDITETTDDITVTITDFRGEHAYTVDKTDQAIADAEQAATNANTAAGGANQAAQAATQAAGTANTSAQNADTKAALADSKAALANQAATTANQAAQAAEAAKTAANTAAGQATTAAGTANTAASNADAKAALADTAATNADTATQAANTATTNATNAAQAANNAAEVAIEAAEDMPKLVGTVDSVQTVSDAWPTTMHGATVYGKCVQDGTPTPNNPVPVQVVGGNIFPLTGGLLNDGETLTSAGVTFTRANNEITATGTSTSAYPQAYLISWSEWLTPGKTYTISKTVSNVPAGGKLYVIVYENDTPTSTGMTTLTSLANLNSRTFMVTKRYTHTIVVAEGNGVTWSGAKIGVTLMEGSTASPYVPYGCIGVQIGESATPIDLQGHTLAGLPDGTRDVLRVNSAGVVTLTKNVQRIALGDYQYSHNIEPDYFYTYQANVIPLRANTRTDNMLATSYMQVSYNSVNTQNGTIGWNNGYMKIHDERYETSADFRAAMANEHVYLPIATPQTIELGTITPPTIAPGDTLAIYASLDPEWAIEYTQDPSIVVNTLQSSIAPVEGSTASTNYAVGAYLMHGNQLYRVTSAIATGEAITPGSNCVACTVMGEVIRLTA